MGIQGLIPFLKRSSRPVNIKDFKGCTVAVDTYCWLHKGAFSCAERLAKGEKTDGYVHYCLKMVNVLLAAGVHPIMVFDGQRLPSKTVTENKRHENRVKYKKKAKGFLLEGKIREARECFQRCTEVTPEMALEVIKALINIGVDCLVAPYEADAQLAYLNKSGIAHIVITEDSDLVPFGCERTLFKFDAAGNGIMIESTKLPLSLGIKAENYTFDKFRYMCIMAGCDYLPSLPGIGLGKACKFFSKVNNPNLDAVLAKIPFYLNMGNLTVTKEYITNFIQANNTFLYQLVFDTLQRKLVPLNSYPPELDATKMDYAGPLMTDDMAYQIALGNVCVDSLKKVANFDPDRELRPSKSHRKSIWDASYKPGASFLIESATPKAKTSLSFFSPSTTSTSTQKIPSTSKQVINTFKRSLSDDKEFLTEKELLNLYGGVNGAKRFKTQSETEENDKNVSQSTSAPSTPRVLVYSRFFSPPLLPQNSPSVQPNDEAACDPNTKVHLKDAKFFPGDADGASVSNYISIANEQGTPIPQKQGLFFDQAVSSRSIKQLNDDSTALKSKPTSGMSSSQIRNFGNWNNLRKHFSYPTTCKLENSPRNHTAFKPVGQSSKYFSATSVTDIQTINVEELDRVGSQSEKSNSTELCSSYSAGHDDSLDCDFSDLSTPTKTKEFHLDIVTSTDFKTVEEQTVEEQVSEATSPFFKNSADKKSLPTAALKLIKSQPGNVIRTKSAVPKHNLPKKGEGLQLLSKFGFTKMRQVAIVPY